MQNLCPCIPTPCCLQMLSGWTALAAAGCSTAMSWIWHCTCLWFELTCQATGVCPAVRTVGGVSCAASAQLEHRPSWNRSRDTRTPRLTSYPGFYRIKVATMETWSPHNLLVYPPRLAVVTVRRECKDPASCTFLSLPFSSRVPVTFPPTFQGWGLRPGWSHCARCLKGLLSNAPLSELAADTCSQEIKKMLLRGDWILMSPRRDTDP